MGAAQGSAVPAGSAVLLPHGPLAAPVPSGAMSPSSQTPRQGRAAPAQAPARGAPADPQGQLGGPGRGDIPHGAHHAPYLPLCPFSLPRKGRETTGAASKLLKIQVFRVIPHHHHHRVFLGSVKATSPGLRQPRTRRVPSPAAAREHPTIAATRSSAPTRVPPTATGTLLPTEKKKPPPPRCTCPQPRSSRRPGQGCGRAGDPRGRTPRPRQPLRGAARPLSAEPPAGGSQIGRAHV